MTSEKSLAALWNRLNNLNDDVIRLQERSKARDEEMTRIKSEVEEGKRWIARGLMFIGSIGIGAAYIVFKQIAESAGLAL